MVLELVILQSLTGLFFSFFSIILQSFLTPLVCLGKMTLYSS